jgi:hypothetical protein
VGNSAWLRKFVLFEEVDMNVAKLSIGVVGGKFVLVDSSSAEVTPMLTLSVELNGRDLQVRLAPAEGEGETAIFEAHNQRDDAVVFAGSVKGGGDESLRIVCNVYYPGRKRPCD